MAMGAAVSLSLICIFSTLWRQEWLAFCISLPGPISLAVGIYLLLRNNPITSDYALPSVRHSKQVWQSLLTLSSVYFVTYIFFYGLLQLSIKGITFSLLPH